MRAFGWLAAAVMLGGCTLTEDVTVQDEPLTASPQDDTPPAATPYDESLTYQARVGLQNHSADRFLMDIVSWDSEDQRADAETLRPSHAAFLSGRTNALPSVQTVGTYFKQLDDTLYAGVERAAQDGLAPTLEPKRTVLQGALEWLAQNRSSAADAAIVYAAAALELGGAPPDVPADLRAGVDGAEATFLANPVLSKPCGFYTWSEALQAIWRQDRFLQQIMDPAAAAALASAIAADDARLDRYRSLLALYSRLTNPLEASLTPLLDGGACPDSGCAFLGPSRSAEVDLFDKLYPGGIPADADLMQDLIDAIRDGTVNLAPQPADGWYAWQEYALETLLVTDRSEERAKAAFSARYKEHLQEAFETMLTQHRETHEKQLSTSTGAAMAPDVPDFRVEPLATVYVRHARSYVFLEAALQAVLGSDVLDGAPAVGAGGPAVDTLRTRMHRARDLFYGLYLVSCEDLGMHPKLDQVGDPAEPDRSALTAAADAWLLGLADDPVAAADVRVLVPIAQLDETHLRYWAVIGVRGAMAGYSFITDPGVQPGPDENQRVELPVETFLEVTSSAEPMTRDEFRALCDSAGTPDAIRAALEAR